MYKRIFCFLTTLAAGAVYSLPVLSQGELGTSERREIVHVAGDVYRFHDKFHVSVFMVTDDGVIATDPITPDAAAWLNNEIRERFDKEVKYVIYSHDHQDHVAGGAAFNGATVIAHENAREPISKGEFPIVMPDITFTDEMAVELGGKLPMPALAEQSEPLRLTGEVKLLCNGKFKWRLWGHIMFRIEVGNKVENGRRFG